MFFKNKTEENTKEKLFPVVYIYIIPFLQDGCSFYRVEYTHCKKEGTHVDDIIDMVVVGIFDNRKEAEICLKKVIKSFHGDLPVILSNYDRFVTENKSL